MSSERQSAAPSTPDSSNFEIPQSWRCICGKGDGSGKYILCDNEDCPVGWYHWECQKVEEEPVGTWLCLTCSPTAAFYAKQLAKKPAASPLVPTLKKGATPSSIKPLTKVPKVASPSSSNEKKIAPRSGPSNTTAISAKEAKKGIAIKKHNPVKPKPEWKGWQRMASDEEENFKKEVDAKFKMEDGVSGRLRRASKVVAEEIESGSRRLRTRSNPNAQVTKKVNTDSDEEEEADSEESVYNEEENEEEGEDEEAGEPVSEDSSDHENVSVNEEASYEHDHFEDHMDLDDGTDHDDKDSLFEGSPDVDEERFEEEEEDHHQDGEGHEMQFDQDDSVEPSNGSPNPSEYEDANDENLSPSPQPPPRVYYAKKRGIPSSPTPESTPSTSSTSSSAGAHDEIIVIDDSVDHITISDGDGDDTESDGDDVDGDGMEIDDDDDEPEVQILGVSQVPASVTPDGEDSDINDPYRVYPESADRSTLPRLG